jgi:hypothetical protein
MYNITDLIDNKPSSQNISIKFLKIFICDFLDKELTILLLMTLKDNPQSFISVLYLLKQNIESKEYTK